MEAPGGSGQGQGQGNWRFVMPKEKDDSIYNGKRMRKAVQRRGVDYNASMLNFAKKRKFRRDLRDDEFVQWDLEDLPHIVEEKAVSHPLAGLHFMPPSVVENCYASSLCTRFTHTSINKVRFPVTAVAMSPDGKRVVTGASSGEFTLWNAQHFNFETILQAHDTAVRSMVFSHSDEFLLSGDHGGVIKYWQPNFNNVKRFQAHEQPLRQLCFSPTDLKFASCSDDGMVKIWDFVRGELDRQLEGHGWDVKTVDWHTSKALLASGAKDNKVKLWDPRQVKDIATIHAHKQTVLGVKWNQNGNWLLTASRDQNAKLFDIRTMKEVQTFRGHKRDVTCCRWHPFHEGLFATGSGDGCIHFYQVGQENPLARIDQAHESTIWDLVWHPFGHEVASISNDQLLRFWTRNRPGDKLDDKHNVTARQEANVDLAKAVRPRDEEGSAAAVELPGGVSVALPNLSTTDMASSIIPGMSSTQAKLRRMRPQALPPTKVASSSLTNELRVLSYDMLAQTNAAARNFPGVSENLLNWSYRSQNLLLEIRQHNADVLCLQECSYYKEFWQPNLKGYQAAYQAHPDPNAAKGVVILTRPQKLALRQAVQVRFTDDDQSFRSVAVIGVYESAASVAAKDSRVPKVMFLIASVSLSNYGNEAKQKEQALVLLQALERAKSFCKVEPGRSLIVNFVLAGNFNMVPDSGCYNLIMANAPGLNSSAPPHSVPLASAYGRFQAGREPLYTTVGKHWTGTTDFVFYSHPEFGVKEVLEFPPKDLLGPSMLPNSDYSSNHFSLQVTFQTQ